MIEITNEQIERVNLILGGIKDAPNKAFYNIINRGLTTVRGQSSRKIRGVYNITHSNLRTETNIYLRKASSSNLSGDITFSGHKIPLARFNITPSAPGKKGMVRASVLKGSGQTTLKHAFIAKMKSGHIGVFERIPGQHMGSRGDKRNKHTEKIGANSMRQTDQFYGPATAQMAGNTIVLNEIETVAQETINKRVEQEISRILSGYGR